VFVCFMYVSLLASRLSVIEAINAMLTLAQSKNEKIELIIQSQS